MRYDKRTVSKIVDSLREMLESSEDSLSNAESADYPNDERIDLLTDRIESLSSAVDALEMLVN